MSQFDLKAQLREAAARVQKEKEEEALADQADYNRLLKSTQWKIFKVMMVFSTLMSVLIGIDSTVEGEFEPIRFSEVQFVSGYLIVEGKWYVPHPEQLVGFDENSFFVQHTPIFNEKKWLCWQQEVWQADETAPKKYELQYTSQRISIYEWFPFLSIALLLPLVVFFFKRPSPWFKFGRFICLLIVYPASLILFFILVT